MMLAQVTIPQFNTTVIHFPMLQNADATTLSIVAGSLIAIGALWCFLGFRLFRAYLGFIGMVIGAVVGVYVAAKIAGINPNAVANITTVNAIPVGLWVGLGVGALAGLLLFSLLYIVGVFLVGAGVGYAVAIIVIASANITANQQGICLASAVGGGVITIFLRKFIIILITSAKGAPLLVLGLAHFMNIRSLSTFAQPVSYRALYQQNKFMAWTTVGLAVGGILVQFFVTSPKKKHAEADDDI
ncbi:MAG: DUF4203 domain-containing protein [Phycisphaerales bacterium]|jgi:hypothetical protein|nr:DUF4203 domain-containing protein [Phycisphaerales bacterium]MBT7171812.1 DUF4203 domain-containing protein [Phycisphaerales bacterium]